MKALVAAIGGAGDIHPFIAVGINLKARGHEVRMLMDPYFERQIHDAGREHVALGAWFDLKRIKETPELNHPGKGPVLTLKKFILPGMPGHFYEHAAETHGQLGLRGLSLPRHSEHVPMARSGYSNNEETCTVSEMAGGVKARYPSRVN